MSGVCIEDYAGGGYHFNLNDAHTHLRWCWNACRCPRSRLYKFKLF